MVAWVTTLPAPSSLSHLVFPGIGVLIAAAVAYIAFQQYTLGREKFKLDMFEKRFAVYKATQRFLTVILRDAKVDMENLFEFRGGTQDATFLFREEIPAYLERLDKQALELWEIAEKLCGPQVGEERSTLSARKKELLQALIDELPALKTVFASYLRFDRWK